MKMKRSQICTAVLMMAFLFSLIPIAYLIPYVQATGDDFGYGALTHAAWLDTGSLWEVLKASFQTIRNYYNGWQGTWFSIFLFSLQPEVFSPDVYWIVPVLMVSLTAVGVSLAGYLFLVKWAGISKSWFLAIDSIVLIMLLQFIPSTKSGIFWYNGTAHYVVPLFLALVSIYAAGVYLDTYRKQQLLLCFVCMTLLGGASYLSALLAPLVLILLLIVKGRKERKGYYLFGPILAEMIGLVVSLLAPGNKVRGGEDLGVHGGQIIVTILDSFRQGILTIGDYLREKPFLFILLAVLAVVLWYALAEAKTEFRYPYPLLFVGMMFCLYCAMFAPGIYAGTELSGGVPNTIFQVFVLTAVADILYCIGWIQAKKRTDERNLEGERGRTARRLAGAGAVLLLLAVMFLTKGTIKDTTFFICLDYIRSGQAADYREQMEERKEILLDDSRKDVELPAMNSDQGPFMHMEVMKDENAWTNTVVRDFYRKERVVEVDRR